MAIERCLSTPSIIHQSAFIRKPVCGLVMLRKNQLAFKRTVALRIRSSIRDQVFEDHSNGIVCYEDNNGEIVCEGFDEGPRIIRQYPSTPYSLREATILDLLPQRWLQILGGETTNGGALVDDHTCNGFNALH